MVGALLPQVPGAQDFPLNADPYFPSPHRTALVSLSALTTLGSCPLRLTERFGRWVEIFITGANITVEPTASILVNCSTSLWEYPYIFLSDNGNQFGV